MAKSRVGTIRGKNFVGWKRAFEDPIDLPRGRQLVTLKDAGTYITKLPKAEQKLEEWQTAMQALLLVVEERANDVCADWHDAGVAPERRAGVQFRSQGNA
jgi:hypothetical protein